MKLWKKYFRRPSAVIHAPKSPLEELAASGVEVVVFVPKSNFGTPCFEAMQLEGGRIPIKLAEATPLPRCNNTSACKCEYVNDTHIDNNSL